MKKLTMLLAFMGAAFISEASVVTDLSQAPGLGGNVDLTAGSYLTWGYDADSLKNGFTNFKIGTTVATTTVPQNDSTRDYGYTFTFNDGNSPGTGTTVASSGGVAGLLTNAATTITFGGIVSSTETRLLTLYLGGYEGGNDSVDLTFDVTLTGGTADETGTARVFAVNKDTSSAAGGSGGGYAIATYTVEFTSATESDVVIDVNYSNLVGTRNWALSGYTVEVVPEPATLGLISIAGLSLLLLRRLAM